MDLHADFSVDASFLPVASQMVGVSRVPVHKLNVPSKTGNKVLLIAQIEVTNPQAYTVGIGRVMLRSDGKVIIPAVMDNVTPQMHHSVITMAGWDASPAQNGEYSLVVYAVSTSAKSGDLVRIEQGYGFLQAAIFE
jgi:hypothetical protein